MRQTLEELHPALYDYIAEETLDSLFIDRYNRIDTALELNDYYKLVQSLIERVGCGHTKLWIPSDYWNTAPRRLFPIRILKSQGRFFVSGYYSSPQKVPVGSEILKINKKPVTEIFKELEAITSSDAYIKSFKSKIAEKHFSKRYALYYGYPEFFSVEYIAPGELSEIENDVKPVSIEDVNTIPDRGSELSLKILKNRSTAILTINTFIYYDRLEMFKSFADSSFKEIRDEGVNNLILDLRGNDGGDPFCASYLLSYLESSPVPYFAEPYGRYAKLAEPIPLAGNNFKGSLFTLIDGLGFSTTGHFCGLLKYHKIGKFIGSETGATFTCTGNVRYINLKNTKLIFGTARERRYTAAVKDMDRQRGVLPDYPVEQSPEDLIANKDTVLDFALKLCPY
jgi:hypothetical protein